MRPRTNETKYEFRMSNFEWGGREAKDEVQMSNFEWGSELRSANENGVAKRDYMNNGSCFGRGTFIESTPPRADGRVNPYERGT